MAGFKSFCKMYQKALASQEVQGVSSYTAIVSGSTIERLLGRLSFLLAKAALSFCLLYTVVSETIKRGLDMTKFRKLLPLAFHQVLQIVIFGK